MAHRVGTRKAEGVTSGLDPTLIVLEDGQGGSAEVWPALGFNCLTWKAVKQNQTLDLLYVDPAVFSNGRPTRSGVPVLFPFPNRIRDGRFYWQGREFSLPLNDSTQKNAIHGFACRRPWRVVGQGADEQSAWVTGEFKCSLDDPESAKLWPSDHQLRLTIRLGKGSLRIEAEVHNPDTKPLPFGLGYHPYFKLPCVGELPPDDCTVEVPAAEYWELKDSLATSNRVPVDASRNLNRQRRVGDLQLDDVLTGLPARPPRLDGLIERGVVGSGSAAMRLFCSPAFREMVVFNPAHRQAFCVEPYTCTTDAVNLQETGVDAGWLVLQPGETWTAVVELWV
jgi:aldose 1-epimerase